MKILALEFSTSQRSVAVLAADADARVVARAEVADSTPGHSMRPLGMVERALKEAGISRNEIECIAVGVGPGSYTGIRVAISIAQGWQLATNLQLCAVSSVECVAQRAVASGMTGRFSVVVDAQRGEFYIAEYESDGASVREVSTLKIDSTEEIRSRLGRGEVFIGPDIARSIPEARPIFHPRKRSRTLRSRGGSLFPEKNSNRSTCVNRSS